MKLGIYSLTGVAFQGEVASVNCTTTNGEITVLDHHRPLLAVLKEGVISIIDKQKKEHYIQARAGFLEVRDDNGVRCIIERV